MPITANQFRTITLAFPNVVESAHMDHPDFRVGGKIFASLGYPDESWGVLMLPPAEQKRLCESAPHIFVPAPGAWGRNGNTQVNLKAATKTTVRPALKSAYEERVRKNGRNSHHGAKAQRSGTIGMKRK